VRLIVAKPGDNLDDPTAPWPLDEHELITIGRLTMTGLVTGEDPPIVFDPSLLAAGIAPTNDPIFAARSAAYRVSFARRTGG
jgi:catalase